MTAQPIEPGSVISDAQLEVRILASLAERAPDASACPSEIARHFATSDKSDWRSLMPPIRRVLAGLVRHELIVVTRGAQILAAGNFDGGPIRIRRGPKFVL